jgi:uncharacterized PurR-regulated membrane protein YhhQ (DUF165 family)
MGYNLFRIENSRIAMVALVTYAAAIFGANWMIRNVGSTVLPDGTHLAPVGFGLLAPSGAYAAGVTFIVRDVVQRTAGRVWSISIIGPGAIATSLLSPRLAMASGIAFLLAELMDLAVYSPLQKRGLVRAVMVSGVAASVADSIVFLVIAGIPLAVALAGLLLAKFWVQLLATPIVAWLRNRITPTVLVGQES